jgi:hypothetical protein
LFLPLKEETMTDQTGAAPVESARKKGSCCLWGCLIIIVLFFISVCCLVTLIFLPFYTDYDPLGLDLRNRIEQYIPWQELLEDPSAIPGMPEFFNDSFNDLLEELPGEVTSSGPATGAYSILLSTYVASDFQAIFDYPTGWEIETEEYGVTFYDTNSYTYLYVGEDLVDSGKTARQVAQEVKDSLMEESQDGSFKEFENTPFSVPEVADAYLMSYEFTDAEGYYQWALNLETVSGETNVFFYLSGEDPEDYQLYRELIEIIAASFTR